MNDESILISINLASAEEAKQKLDDAYNTFTAILDYVAGNYPQVLEFSFPQEVSQEVEYIFDKHELPVSWTS